MKAVVQRVAEASVEVDGAIVARVSQGLLILLGVEKSDGPDDAMWLARKIPSLRIFGDEQHNMNRTVAEVGGEILVISQFTLASSVNRGRRPSFATAAAPAEARVLYDLLVAALASGPVPVRTGLFGAMMRVHLINDGPVTFIVEHPHR